MPEQELIEVSKLQLNRSKDIIKYISEYIGLGDYNGAINRAYYSVFHAMKAVEVLEGFDSKKHSGVIAFFRQNYIKTGIFDSEMSDIIGNLQKSREDSDYNIIAEFNIDDAKDAYEKAKVFVSSVEKFLDEKIG